jgi:hypothetical protein
MAAKKGCVVELEAMLTTGKGATGLNSSEFMPWNTMFILTAMKQAGALSAGPARH